MLLKMDNIYKMIWNTLPEKCRALDKTFDIDDMRRILRECDPQTFASGGTFDERFPDAIEITFNKVIWDLLREGVFVPTIQGSAQSNACISFERFFVSDRGRTIYC